MTEKPGGCLLDHKETDMTEQLNNTKQQIYINILYIYAYLYTYTHI